MYTSQDKYEMTIRQARGDIGQGIGNALSNAVGWVKGNPIYEKLSENELKQKIEECWDMFFHASQVKIDKAHISWLEINDEALKEKFDIQPDPNKTFVNKEIEI